MRLNPLPQQAKPNWPQRPKPQRWKVSRKSVVAISFWLILGTGSYLALDVYARLWQLARDGLLAYSVKQGFGLKYMLVNGRKNLDEADFYRALGLHQNTPLLAIDLEAARLRLLEAPWVKDVTITRIMPDRLRIDIKEAAPFALWQRDEGSGFTLVDDKGSPIAGVDPRLYPLLPVIVGEGAPIQAPEFLTLLKEDAELFKHVKRLTYVAGRRWNVRFDHGLEVKLPESAPENAWALLGQLARQQKILDRMISSIDLRVPDKIFVEMPSSPLLQSSADTGNSI